MPNERLMAFLAEHVVEADRCACGWDMGDYDIQRYDWENDDAPARRRAWIAHVEREWGEAHALGKIQQASTTDPNGDEVVFDMEPGHDTLGVTPGRRYHGAYRYDDYEPPPRPPGNAFTTPLSCKEASCRDPHCFGGHFIISSRTA